MAKKTARKTKKKIKKIIKRVPITKEQWLEHLIAVSEKQISTHGNTIDEFFRNQADRLKKELKELRLKNESSKNIS